MLESNLIQFVSALFVGTGLSLIAIAFRAGTRDQLPAHDLPAISPSFSDEESETAEIDAAFEAFTRHSPVPEFETIYEVPADHIRPGDLLQTVKIPALVQTFKFREKKTQQPLIHS